MTDHILFETRGALAIATLHRPAALNAQNSDMVHAFARQLEVWEQDPTITTLFIHGAGEKAFCAGGDIRALWQMTLPDQLDFFKTEYELCYQLATTRLITIAYMDGITMGGGVGLSINADIRLATERTLWAMPEVMIGFFPDIAGGYFLPRNKLGAGFGRYLGLTGARLNGSDCVAAGIATHYMPSGIDDALITAIAQQAIDSFTVTAPATSMPAIAAELEAYKDAPLDEFLVQLKTRDLLPADASPSSQQVIDALLKIGTRLSYRQTVDLDMRIVKHFLTKNSSFDQGVQARLIDRTQPPEWIKNPPKTLSEAEISGYFA